MYSLFNPLSSLFGLPESLIWQVGLSILGSVLLYGIISSIFKRQWKHERYQISRRIFRRITLPLALLLTAVLLQLNSVRNLPVLAEFGEIVDQLTQLLFVIGFTWLILSLLKMIKNLVLLNYDLQSTNNLRARSVHTQFNILERIVVFLVVISAIGIALMTFKEIRQLGISVFTTAGVAGIIIGFSAQKLIATILAGIQIAIAQPIKLDDVVIVEGEWGRIEEITLTYVVVRIWDKRRLIVPTTYFIDTPFQNWTKSSADLLGTVFLYTDYTLPVDKIREALHSIVRETDLWDGEVAITQVTDAKMNTMEIRCLVSASDASTAFDLRVFVREKLIEYLQKNYPESLPKTRIEVLPISDQKL